MPSGVLSPADFLPRQRHTALSVPETGEVGIPLLGPQNKDPDSRSNNPGSQWESKTLSAFPKVAAPPPLPRWTISVFVKPSHANRQKVRERESRASSHTWSWSWELCSGLAVRGNTGLLTNRIVGSRQVFLLFILVQVEYGRSGSSFSRICCPGEKVTCSSGLADHSRTRETGRLC